MCTFNEIGFLRLSKGVWNWTNSEGVFFSADYFQRADDKSIQGGLKSFCNLILAIKGLFFTMSRGGILSGNVIGKPGCMPKLCILRKS